MNITKKLTSLAVGAAMAGGIGIASAAPAHAATSVWDSVAACESSGNWSTNTGNGYYGGLQFSESTWLAYGGGAYAQYANNATRAQQIAVAQKVLASQGVNAWPVCGPKAGLTKANGGASSTATTSTTSTSTSTSSTAKTSSTQTSSSRTSSTRVSTTKASSGTSPKSAVKPAPVAGHKPAPRRALPPQHAGKPAPKGPHAPRPGHGPLPRGQHAPQPR